MEKKFNLKEIIKNGIKSIWKSLFIIISIIILVFGLIIAGIIYKNYKELPDIEELVSTYKPAMPSMIFDRNEVLIDTLYRERRELIKLEDINENVINAFIAIEDKKFKTHYGLNIKRIVGSIVQNLKNRRAVQGGSTLTQQLAKNAFLSNEKKLSRKIKEMLITFELERIFTKEEILEKYLNEIYFGGGAYGIRSASWQFFRKEPKDLNIAESALLAGIPNRPERYNPRRNLDNAVERAQIIIKEMYQDGVITEEEFETARAHKFLVLDETTDLKSIDLKTTTLIHPREQRTENAVPEYMDLVYSFLRNYRDENGEAIFNENALYTQGLKIYTAVDLEFQRTAREIANKNAILNRSQGLEIGMATIDSNTGELVSVLGGKNYIPGNFNRSNMAKRQIGSTAKSFLYFAAITRGAGLNDIKDDSPVKYGSWQPKNYGGGYRGQITLLEALDRSINTVSVKLLDEMKLKTLRDVINEFGVNFRLPEGLTAALGAYEGTPIEVAQAYALFSNGGFSVKPIIIRRIEDNKGNILYSSEIKKERKFDSSDVSLLNYMLQSSVKNGTSTRARVRDLKGNAIIQGGKTGTTNENRTVWYAGITPRYSTAIYLGYDDNRPISRNMTGGTGPAPIWAEYYQALINKGLYKPERFRFVDENINNGTLIEQRLSSKLGLIPNENGPGRDFLIRAGKLSLEREDKFKNGIKGIISSETETRRDNNRPTSSFIDNLINN